MRDKRQVSEFYSKDPSAKIVLDYFNGLGHGITNVTVSQIEAEKRYPRQGVIEVFKQLAEWGWGEIKVGRRGRDTRFESYVDPRDIAQFAKQSPPSEVTSSDRNETGNGDEELIHTGDSSGGPSVHQKLVHRYLLRPDYAVNISLPVDLTNAEATRLADFVKSLPFA